MKREENSENKWGIEAKVSKNRNNNLSFLNRPKLFKNHNETKCKRCKNTVFIVQE